MFPVPKRQILTRIILNQPGRTRIDGDERRGLLSLAIGMKWTKFMRALQEKPIMWEPIVFRVLKVVVRHSLCSGKVSANLMAQMLLTIIQKGKSCRAKFIDFVWETCLPQETQRMYESKLHKVYAEKFSDLLTVRKHPNDPMYFVDIPDRLNAWQFDKIKSRKRFLAALDMLGTSKSFEYYIAIGKNEEFVEAAKDILTKAKKVIFEAHKVDGEFGHDTLLATLILD